MVALAKEWRRNPGIRYLSAGLVHDVAAKDFVGEINAVFQYVQQNIRYLQDINNVETIQTPEATLTLGQGDCDDFSTLLASMLESIGHPCRFTAVGFEVPGEYDHVFIQTLIGTRWVALDATEPEPMGWTPPGICTWLIRNI